MIKNLLKKFISAVLRLVTDTREAADSSSDALVEGVELFAKQNVFGKAAHIAAESIEGIDFATNLLKEKRQEIDTIEPTTFTQAFTKTLRVMPREVINKFIVDKKLVKISKSIYKNTGEIYHNIKNIGENPLEKIHNSTECIINASNNAATQSALIANEFIGGVNFEQFQEFYNQDPRAREALEKSEEYAEKGLEIIASACNPLSVIEEAAGVANKIAIATNSIQKDVTGKKDVDAQQKLNQSRDQASKALDEFVVDAERLLNKVKIESESAFERGLNFFQNLIKSSQNREDKVRGG